MADDPARQNWNMADEFIVLFLIDASQRSKDLPRRASASIAPTLRKYLAIWSATNVSRDALTSRVLPRQEERDYLPNREDCHHSIIDEVDLDKPARCSSRCTIRIRFRGT
jgi:hypothetical protein